MTKIALVGAGEMGRASLEILVDALPDASFRVIDRSDEGLEKAAALAPDRILTECTDVHASPPDLRDVDLVLNFAGPFYTGQTTLAKAAIAGGCTYLDICDDVEGIRPILALDREARDAGVSLITGGGNSPGTSNVMAKRLLELHPDCDGIRVVWVVADTDPGGLAPLRHMLHMAVAPCTVWRDGAFVDEDGYVPQTATSYDLPDIGPTEVYNTAHSEPITMARAFDGLRYIGVQGGLLPAWSNELFSALGRIGFGYDDLVVEIDGRPVEPVEVLWRVLWARHDRRHGGQQTRNGLTIVTAQALKGEAITATMSVVDPHSMVRTTAIGASSQALAIVEQSPRPGAWGTEILEAQHTLELLEEIAANVGAIPGGLRYEVGPVVAGDRLG